MNVTLNQMRNLWQQDAGRDVSELWDAILAMSDDPVDVADRIAEASQTDKTVAVSDETMDAINTLAADE